MNDNKVLTRDEYFQIILEIYELERITVGSYLEDKYQTLISKNSEFVKCLYKDIYTVLDGIQTPDLLIKNGDFVIEYGDLKLDGKTTNLDSALIWLHQKLIEEFMRNAPKNNPLEFLEQMKRFEDDFLQRDYNTPAVSQKIAKLNKEIKMAIKPRQKRKTKKRKPTPQPAKPKTKLLTAPVIALFCRIVNESTILSKGDEENNSNYCKRICTKFNLTYSDRVRQNFSNKQIPKNLKKIKELILPIINKTDRKKIKDYLDNKDQSNQKLYA